MLPVFASCAVRYSVLGVVPTCIKSSPSQVTLVGIWCWHLYATAVPSAWLWQESLALLRFLPFTDALFLLWKRWCLQKTSSLFLQSSLSLVASLVKSISKTLPADFKPALCSTAADTLGARCFSSR